MTSLTVTDTIITRALSEGRLLLSEVESKNLLVAEGISVTDAQLARDPDEAASVAEIPSATSKFFDSTSDRSKRPSDKARVIIVSVTVNEVINLPYQ
jgi:acyl-CoA synthetase (NDP forming)